MKIYKSIIMFTISALSMGLCQAQQSANVTGGNAFGIGGTVNYSVGQVFFKTNSTFSGTVSQGVQQSYEIYALGNNEIDKRLTLSIFPNPTNNYLIVEVNEFESSMLNFQLFDLNGKLLNVGKIVSKQTQINTIGLKPATYFVHIITHENKKIQSFKIIKN